MKLRRWWMNGAVCLAGLACTMALARALSAAAGTAGTTRWEPVKPLPGIVKETFQVALTGGADGAVVGSYAVTMPTPCERFGQLGPALRDGNRLVLDLALETPADTSCLTALHRVEGRLELGMLPAGEYTLVAASHGETLGTYPFTVARTAAADPGAPRIESVLLNATEVIATVRVPAGLKKVTLETRTRLGAGTWVPRAVQRVEGTGGTLEFRLARSAQLEVLRVRGDAEESLPTTFFAGPTNFTGQATATEPQPLAPGRGLEDAAAPGANLGGAAGQSRDVVESDIWKLRGDRLYFFNQMRGLQVVDLAGATPVLRATLELPAAGEQMYVLEAGADTYVALLARSGCGGWSGQDTSEVLLVHASPLTTPEQTSAPQIVARVAVPGYIQESRLVGTALYVASQTYRRIALPPKPGSSEPAEQWEWGTVVSSFDLADPRAPLTRDTLWFSGYGNVIYATDRFLCVGTQDPNNWWQTVVRLVDISSPTGTMKSLATVRPVGRVADKFKLNIAGEVFAVISENANWGANARRASVLETYSLADPTAPAKLGVLEVGHGESLFATRFDGNRAYIVTFLRIDPLWVVDLSDPAKPTLSGELHVPGWSTYIQPLGDKLVAMGIDNSNSWKVAVSLFDVKDPTKPSLLSKVPLGENHSWSEANHDEKAFTVLPEAGLLLVPYQGYTTNGYASRVQLIDLDLAAGALKARGFIEHRMQPRRATAHGDRLVSISSRELLAVDAADRDHPVVQAQVDLAWPVNRVFLAGDYAVELEEGNSWNGAPTPTLRVVSTQDPSRVLSRLDLPVAWGVIGSAQSDGHLLLAQSPYAGGWWWGLPETAGDATNPVNPANFRLTAVDLTALPTLKLAGSSESIVKDLSWGAALKPLWVKPGLLVWSTGAQGYWRWLDWGPAVGGIARGDALRPMPGWWGGGRLLACDVGDPAAPKLVSDFSLAQTDRWWDYSDAFTAGGLVYVSHQTSEFVPDGRSREVVVTQPDGTKEVQPQPTGAWVQRYFLDVVDYADPTTPTPRLPVNVPGRLVGLSHATDLGALLYTVGIHWDATGTKSDYTEWLDVTAYDGVQAALVNSRQLPTAWPHPLAVAQGLVVIGTPADTTAGTGASLDAYVVTALGTLDKLATQPLADTVQTLAVVGDVLVAQAQSENRADLYRLATPNPLTLIGTGTPSGCLWFSLEQAQGNSTQGVWIPLADYGLLHVPVGVRP